MKQLRPPKLAVRKITKLIRPAPKEETEAEIIASNRREALLAIRETLRHGIGIARVTAAKIATELAKGTVSTEKDAPVRISFYNGSQSREKQA